MSLLRGATIKTAEQYQREIAAGVRCVICKDTFRGKHIVTAAAAVHRDCVELTLEQANADDATVLLRTMRETFKYQTFARDEPLKAIRIMPVRATRSVPVGKITRA